MLKFGSQFYTIKNANNYKDQLIFRPLETITNPRKISINYE